MARLSVISDAGATETDARVDRTAVWVSPESVDAVLGWQVKPEGLCRDDVCVPAVDALRRNHGGNVDLVAVAEALQRPTLLDVDAGALVIGASAGDRRDALRDKQLPSFALPDLDGRIHLSDEWRGEKILLAAFASW